MVQSTEARTPKRVNHHDTTSFVKNSTVVPFYDQTPPSTATANTVGSSSRFFMNAPPTTGGGHGGSGRTQPAKRLYCIGDQKWVTREIASLDFLLGIPLAAEQQIVKHGFQMQLSKQNDEDRRSTTSMDDDTAIRTSNSKKSSVLPSPNFLDGTKHKGAWWEKWIPSSQSAPHHHGSRTAQHQHDEELLELERPTQADVFVDDSPRRPISYAPGRRLDGDPAIRVQIPIVSETQPARKTSLSIVQNNSIARQSAIRQWELQTAHGIGQDHPPLLDGRIFFSADCSYPVAIYSCLRYAPKREEAAERRRKLEAIGGGGTQFIMPARDWRGISYRALLRRGVDDDEEEAFNRFVRTDKEEEEKDDGGSNNSCATFEDSHGYEPGLLDDPEMVLGRHRNVMIGNSVVGPIVSSTIQFVDPVILKEELNKQFRERFDGWEPPKGARKYIGARVIQGNYVLRDPTEDGDDHSYDRSRRKRQGSVTSMDTIDETTVDKTMRIPPSLTLSKIRSLKRQALQAAVQANLNIGSLALSCVYFERLCLDCRVDKSNRRLTFAACILLAAKLNEPNVGLVMEENEDGLGTRIQSRVIKSNKRGGKMFASLLYFFTECWHLSLKHLFAAEWGVFAALGFSLHSSPSHVAFHFLRFMKTLEWKPMEYLGPEMFAQWQKALKDDEERRLKRRRRQDAQRKQNEERILSLHMELESGLIRRQTERMLEEEDTEMAESPSTKRSDDDRKPKKSNDRRLSLFNRLVLRKSMSHERLPDSGNTLLSKTTHDSITHRRGSDSAPRLVSSESMPILSSHLKDNVAIDIPEKADSVSSSFVLLDDGGNDFV